MGDPVVEKATPFPSNAFPCSCSKSRIYCCRGEKTSRRGWRRIFNAPRGTCDARRISRRVSSRVTHELSVLASFSIALRQTECVTTFWARQMRKKWAGWRQETKIHDNQHVDDHQKERSDPKKKKITAREEDKKQYKDLQLWVTTWSYHDDAENALGNSWIFARMAQYTLPHHVFRPRKPHPHRTKIYSVADESSHMLSWTVYERTLQKYGTDKFAVIYHAWLTL